jgi:hypothetical protein
VSARAKGGRFYSVADRRPSTIIDKSTHDTVRVPKAASERERIARLDRDRVAQSKTAAFALDTDDPAEWLADILGYLGLGKRVTA